VLPIPLAGFKGPTSKGREGKKGKGRGGDGSGEERRGGKAKRTPKRSPSSKFAATPLHAIK